jgi:hypothetical protein
MSINFEEKVSSAIATLIIFYLFHEIVRSEEKVSKQGRFLPTMIPIPIIFREAIYFGENAQDIYVRN